MGSVTKEGVLIQGPLASTSRVTSPGLSEVRIR